ncbi:hypothetical protein AC578_1445 [Pseudocercospora eumusae]|uniref:Heterokaryon incompatibility domain-containing protein n=1 Tax=Pseudocercospora eumusae TaxID=321146 RepID=A0A139GTJ9_9PEZI|nr:hypothetical protein AC578_1445 [Pseudocercospora eumusae]
MPVNHLDDKAHMDSSLDALSVFQNGDVSKQTVEHRTATGQPSGLAAVPDFIYPHVTIKPDCQIRVLELLPGAYHDDICCNLVVQDVDLETTRNRPKTAQRDITGDMFNASFVNYFAKNVTWAQTKRDLWQWAPAKYRNAHMEKVQSAHVQAHAAQSASPAFNALSYTWGSWDDHQHITLQGQAGFPVTKNLYNALRRIRSAAGTYRLWVDALCINQHDITERNAQVRSMGIIYSIAWDVFIWLGDVEDSSIQDRSKLSARELRASLATMLHEVVATATPSWWTRSWVLQEFLMARQDPVVYFGDHEMRWTEMVGLGKKVKEDRELSWKGIREGMREGDKSEERPIERVGTPFFAFSSAKYMANNGDLASLGWAWAQTQSTDPRDKVYALLGLLDKRESDLITVDYNIELGRLYMEATYASIAANENLHILQFVKSARSEITLPSWAVDFSYSYKTEKSDWFASTDMSKYLFAEPPKPWCQAFPQITAQASLNLQTRSLSLRGLEFDNILHTFETNKGDYFEEFLQGVMDFAKSPLSLFGDRPILLTPDEQKVWSLITDISTNPYDSLRDRMQRPLLPSRRSQASTADGNSRPPLPPRSSHSSTQSPGSNASEGLRPLLPPRPSQSSSSPSLPAHNETIMQMWSLRIFSTWTRRFGGESLGYRSYGLWKAYLSSLSTYDTFFITKSGFVGIGHKSLTKGDLVSLMYGANWPVMLRPQGDGDGRYEFLGFAFVNGICGGELAKKGFEVRLREREFVIV